jgi:glycerophosphoryl diester phosphodiesterase
MKNARSVPWRCSLAMLLVLANSLSAPAGDRKPAPPQVVAHRGLFRHAPENTLAAFRACLELRTGFEFDVRRSRDGRLICIHDATLDRTTNGTGRVSDQTLEELRRLDAGSWFDPAFRGERIPTVDEVFALLARYRNRLVLVAVDVKDADPQIEADLVELARKHRVLDRLVFIGRTIEHREVRRRFKKANPSAQTAVLVSGPDEFDGELAGDADWIYVRYLPSRDAVRQAHRAGKRVFLAGPLVAGYEEANWQEASDAGLDAVLTDFPLELNRMRRERAGGTGDQSP